MSKLINQPIQLQAKAVPRFHCGHEFKVKYILNHWRKAWWLDEPELFV